MICRMSVPAAIFIAVAAISLAGGCASESAKKGPEASPARIGLNALRAGTISDLTDAESVDNFTERLGEHARAKRWPCCAALVKDFPDLALASYRQNVPLSDKDSGEICTALARAYQAAFQSDVLLAGCQARADNPEKLQKALEYFTEAHRLINEGDTENALEKAESARAIFASIGSRFFAEEAGQTSKICLGRIKSASPAWATPSAPTKFQQISRYILEARLSADTDVKLQSIKKAINLAMTGEYWSPAVLIEQTRTDPAITLQISPSEERVWLLCLGHLAVRRGQGLTALRCALSCRRLSEELGKPCGSFEDRFLLIRAHLANGDAQNALEESLAASTAAKDTGNEHIQARALAMTGESLMAMHRTIAAATVFEKAAMLMKKTGDFAGHARQTLNSARACLRQDNLKKAAQALDDAAGAVQTGKAGVIREQIGITRALLSLADGNRERAAEIIKRTLQSAATNGHYKTVEDCLEILKRIKKQDR